MTRYQFPEGFLWGAAASGPQTEGISQQAAPFYLG
ncbi:beta-glucosidase [Klebsiella michiganensis]|uniref:Beta-glucosidase n=1 Tax=Klebsiella michiganensis TaxID=1134687 RepID=A0A7H4PMI4_9ENTR|nr:beta-glucosidase [Klebsiella michiganensis]